MENHTINETIFEQFPVLETERLTLREYKDSDAPALLKIRSDERVMQYMDTQILDSLAAAEKMLAQRRQIFIDKQGINWVLEEKESGDFIGDFGIWRIDRAHCRGEIGYMLRPESWGRGLMRESMERILEFAFHRLALHSIEANVNPANDNSKYLLERMGFQQEAYFRENFQHQGHFLDSAIYSLLEKDFRNLDRK